MLIDAEAYFRDAHPSPRWTTPPPHAMAVPAVVPSGGVTAQAMSVLAWPEPPVPGPLDDNVFVDAGALSRFVPRRPPTEIRRSASTSTPDRSMSPAGSSPRAHRPEPDSIRPEEWINAFDYGDPRLTGDGLALGVEGAFLVHAEPDVATVRIGVSTVESSTPSSAPRRMSRSSSTHRVRWASAIAWLGESSWRCWYAPVSDARTIAIVTYGADASSLLPPHTPSLSGGRSSRGHRLAGAPRQHQHGGGAAPRLPTGSHRPTPDV